MTEPELKQRAQATWSAGDYASIAERIAPAGERTVEAAEVKEGDEVLDVACGAGNATIPAARRGARVIGLDITPELLERGKAAAAEAGVEVEWVEGDAEQLPYDDASFDVVVSVFGCMFAPDHGTAAAEIARVLRPGGRMAIASWRPEGAIGSFFKTVSSYMPPPPEGFQPPVLWGTEDHVRSLFDGTGVELSFEPAAVPFEFDDAEEVTAEFEQKFGPVIMAKRALEPEGKWEALRADLLALFEQLDESGGPGIAYSGDYLLSLGRKAES